MYYLQDKKQIDVNLTQMSNLPDLSFGNIIKYVPFLFVFRLKVVVHQDVTCIHKNYSLCAGQIVLPPSPPRGSLGVRRKMCVLNKGGALEKIVFI